MLSLWKLRFAIFKTSQQAYWDTMNPKAVEHQNVLEATVLCASVQIYLDVCFGMGFSNKQFEGGNLPPLLLLGSPGSLMLAVTAWLFYDSTWRENN